MPIPTTVLATIASLYGISASSLKPASGGHFAHVYEYQVGQKHSILRITPPNNDIELHSMRSILEWLAFLADHGGPVARPLRSMAGNLIERAGSAGQVYISVAFEKAPGVLAEGMSPAEWSDELFQALGEAVGLCHHIARGYFPAQEFRRPDWDQTTNCFHPPERLGEAGLAVQDRHAQVLASLQVLTKGPEDYGLVHLDLHFGNFFVDVQQQKVILFDFDDCAYGWYIMDIAMLLFDVLVVYAGPGPQRFGRRFLENLLTGYRRQNQIDRSWIGQLPLFLKLVEIGVYQMLAAAYDPATADEWVGKFMPGRRERIEQGLAYVELDFLDIARRAGI